MLADPTLLPLTFGGAFGAVAPSKIRMFCGLTVTDGLSLLSEMKTPPLGAGCAKVTGKATVSPTRSVTLAGSTIPLGTLTTVTLAVVSAIFGRALA